MTVAEGPAAPLALAAARAVTEAVAGRIAASLRPASRAPRPRTRLLLGSGSSRVAQHSAAQRAHGPRLPRTSGSAPQGAQRRPSPAMPRPSPASTQPGSLDRHLLTRSPNRCSGRYRLHPPPRPPRLCALRAGTAGPRPPAFATKRGREGACARRASGRGGERRACVVGGAAPKSTRRAGTGNRVGPCCRAVSLGLTLPGTLGPT